MALIGIYKSAMSMNTPNNATLCRQLSLFGTALPDRGASLPVTLPPPPLAAAVQLAPQAYPDGQHPPPFDGAQVCHPVAHTPVARFAVEIPSPVGATIVIPLPLTSVVLAVAGQLVFAQSRPT